LSQASGRALQGRAREVFALGTPRAPDTIVRNNHSTRKPMTMNDVDHCNLQPLSNAELETVEGGCVFVIAIAVLALELHIWDMMVSN
jgi:hypothetical protein